MPAASSPRLPYSPPPAAFSRPMSTSRSARPPRTQSRSASACCTIRRKAVWRSAGWCCSRTNPASRMRSVHWRISKACWGCSGKSPEERVMQFGYFTLSDNHYADNRRGANQFVADILDEAVYAEQVGLHSAWIGEHHFSTLGVLSCPDLVLAQVAARTSRIRLAPAVSVLPLHHPIRVAEQWATLDLLSGGRVDFAAGRGYDRREYAPFHVSFEDNQSIFEEGMGIVRQLWASDAPISHRGRHYQFDNVAITPRPVQRPIPAYVASFSRPSIELAGRLGCNLIVAPFAAALTFGGL